MSIIVAARGETGKSSNVGVKRDKRRTQNEREGETH
jgi:hypothetical protein